MPLHYKLVHAVTEYDRKQSAKRGYSIYALAHYIGAIQRVSDEIAKGYSVRSAILNNLTGRLCDVCLKVAGEPKQTRDEMRGWGIREER